MRVQLLLFAFLIAPAHAADWFVDASAACALGDGSSAHPFCTIADALGLAAAGDRVLVRAGRYPESLVLTRDVQVIGTAGYGSTRIDAGGHSACIEIDGAAVVLQGLTITGGRAHQGAGVLSMDCALELYDCRITDNQAAASTTTPSGGRGAGLFASGGSVVMERVLIDGNIAENGTGSAGFGFCGGLYVTHLSYLTIAETEVAGNRAWYYGGAFIDDVAGLQIARSTFQGNRAQAACTETLCIARSAGTLENCTISSPSGFGEGLRILLGDAGSMGLEHCTFQEASCVSSLFVRREAGSLSTVRVSSSVFAGTLGPLAQQAGSIVSGGHNVIEPALSPSSGFVDGVAGDRVGVGPVDLLALANNGGSTSTMALGLGSPARGAGDPLSMIASDQRGVPRLGDSRDAGAFEATEGGVVSICMSEPNSTGRSARIVISGDPTVGAGVLALTAHTLPAGGTVLFLTSRAADFVAMPGNSQGNLCLGDPVGRFLDPGEVGPASPSGVRTLAVDLLNLPQPTGQVSAVAGETWFFQAWHRDASGSAATSNFTDAAALLVQ